MKGRAASVAFGMSNSNMCPPGEGVDNKDEALRSGLMFQERLVAVTCLQFIGIALLQKAGGRHCENRKRLLTDAVGLECELVGADGKVLEYSRFQTLPSIPDSS